MLQVIKRILNKLLPKKRVPIRVSVDRYDEIIADVYLLKMLDRESTDQV